MTARFVRYDTPQNALSHSRFLPRHAVGVLPSHRHRGIARSLIGGAARLARERWSTRQLVIVADAGGAAERIYRRAGFLTHQREAALWIAAG